MANIRLEGNRPMGRLFFYWVMVLVTAMLTVACAEATTSKTVIQDVIYRADGTPAQGTLLISWPAFTTAGGDAVAAGTTTINLGTDGSVNFALFPNTGSNPQGTYYKVVLDLNDGTRATEFWVVPEVPQTTVAAMRSKVVPQSQAMQFVGRDYVDSAVSTAESSSVQLSGNQTIAGVKTFQNSPVVPAPSGANDVASKNYVDTTVAGVAVSLASPSPIGSTTPSSAVFTTTTVKSVNTIRFADQFAGTDCGAKINAADADLGATAGEIWVNQNCGLTWSTAVKLSSGHNVKFIQGGIYVVAPGNIVLGNNLVDYGTAMVQLAAGAPSGGAIWNLTDGTNVASNVEFRNGTMDGNLSNQTAPCDHFWTCTYGVNIQGTATTAPSNISVHNVAFTNWQGRGVAIHGYNEALPFPFAITIEGNTFNGCGENCVGSSGLDHDIVIRNNRFTNWGLRSLNAWAAVYAYQNGPVLSKSWTITGNKFANTTATEYATELYGGQVGANFYGVTYANNSADANAQVGGAGLSAAIVNGSVTGNVVSNGGTNCTTRCGFEIAGQNVTVSGNHVYNGSLAVMSSTYLQAGNNTITGNVVVQSGTDSGGGIVVAGGTSGPQNNTVVGHNLVDVSAESGNCPGIMVGAYGALAQFNNILVQGNVINGPGTSNCHGVRFQSLASPQSSGLLILDNTIQNVLYGIMDSATDTSTTDITVAGNHIINAATPVGISLAAGSTVRQYLNVSSPTQSFSIVSSSGTFTAGNYITTNSTGQIVDSGSAAPPNTMTSVGTPVHLTGLTATTPASGFTTIYTPTSDGTYLVCFNLVTTTAGSSGTTQIILANSPVAGLYPEVGSGVLSLTSITEVQGCTPVHSAANQPIQYRLPVTSNSGGVFMADVDVYKQP